MNIENPIFAMITDFGFDFAVASMKALILQSCPNATIVDIDHSIKHFSILSAAFVINKVYKYFPKNTIFICVIDPGVGSNRNLLCVDTGTYKFIGPNNGIFHYLLKDRKLNKEVYTIRSSFKPVRSNTFHGRDVITPIAIELAKNNTEILQPFNVQNIVFIPLLESDSFVVTYIDGFGNIKTNISVGSNLKDKRFLKISLNNRIYEIKFVGTFSNVRSGELLCYRGSNNTLEIATNLGSAKEILNADVGDELLIV